MTTVSINNIGASNTSPNNGKTSVMSTEMKDKAYNICREFLSGEWKKITSDDMVFKTISGGLSNFLFYCSLPSTHTPLSQEPSQVLLRMYGQLHDGNDLKITDSVITMLLSERNLGPKLYGIFPGGRLEEYIPARAMTCKELKNPIYSASIARKLATVHTLDVPINKEPVWMFETIQRWLDYMRTNITLDQVIPSRKKIASELLAYDFEGEIYWLKQFLSKSSSPVVFSHNDLQEGNILLPENASLSASSFDHTIDDRIVFIDFEFCSYNYRGFDIANHFCERMFDYSNPQWPHYNAYMDAWPKESAKRHFIREYLKQFKAIHSNKENNTSWEEKLDTEEHLLKEAESFALASHMLWTLWAVHNAQTSKIQFGYWEYAKTRLTAYNTHKDQLMTKMRGAGKCWNERCLHDKNKNKNGDFYASSR